MKILKRVSIVLLFLVIIFFAFRGWIYRSEITYKSLGVREEFPITHPTLHKLIDGVRGKQEPANIHQIINRSLSLTSKQLSFTGSTSEIDPNKLVTSRKAHCVGYANFFTAICNHLIKESNLSGEWEATTRIGHIYLLGTDVHTYFKTPFFKDHDFVTIENKVTGEVFAVDPSLHDYSIIKSVRFKS